MSEIILKTEHYAQIKNKTEKPREANGLSFGQWLTISPAGQ